LVLLLLFDVDVELESKAKDLALFNYRKLQIPFLKKDGTVGNFLLERDWFLV